MRIVLAKIVNKIQPQILCSVFFSPPKIVLFMI